VTRAISKTWRRDRWMNGRTAATRMKMVLAMTTAEEVIKVEPKP
jgi:hypothetical protein